MKKLMYLMPALALIIFSSCEKEGPTGLTGENGKDGTDGGDGAANVEVFHFDVKGSSFYKNYDVPNNSYEKNLWSFEERDNKFFDVDIDKDIVFIYINSHDNSVLGEVFTALPTIFTLNASTHYKYEYSIATDNSLDVIIIDVETLENDVIDTSLLPDSEFKVVKISGTGGTNKKSDLPDIDFTNYKEVKSYYNLN